MWRNWIFVGALVMSWPCPAADEPIPLPKEQPGSYVEQQTPTKENRGTDQSPIVVKILKTEKTNGELNDEEAKKRDESDERARKTKADDKLVELTGDLARYTLLLFIATAILVLVTGALVCVGFLQVKDAKKSIDASEAAANAARDTVILARDEFHASQRPKLVIHSVRLLPDLRKDQPAEVEFAIVNAGTAECTVTGSAVHMEYAIPSDRQYLPNLRENGVITAQRFMVGARDEFKVTGGARENSFRADRDFKAGFGHPVPISPHDNERVLYLGGWVEYSEMGGSVRTTYFRRMLSIAGNHFTVTDDPDDEKTY